MTKIRSWVERCDTHPDHNGIVTHAMIKARMQEEIDDLRAALSDNLRAALKVRRLEAALARAKEKAAEKRKRKAAKRIKNMPPNDPNSGAARGPIAGGPLE